jgi:hypothetical protein
VRGLPIEVRAELLFPRRLVSLERRIRVTPKLVEAVVVEELGEVLR